MRIRREFPHASHDRVEPNRIRVEHRPAAVDREAVAHQVHDVDVRGALRDLLLEDRGTLVDERVDEPVDDFLVVDLARHEARGLAARATSSSTTADGYAVRSPGL